MGKNKIFQDSTQGYITVPDEYVRELIDIFAVQRLKGVQQTGIRPIFSGATHDRFSHSMGVYNLGCQIYAALKINTLKQINDEKTKRIVKAEFDSDEILFKCACILHDIGHPAYAHTLEYLYNNDFICLNPVGTYNKTKEIDADEIKRMWDVFLEIKCNPALQKADNSILKDKLKKAIADNEDIMATAVSIKAQPHEMMSAYQILIDEELQKALKSVIGSKNRRKNYFAFMARMIVGAKYNLIGLDDTKKIEYSIRNCIISILNGKIDADNIDYLNRNAHFAGYATAKMDMPRLTGAFSSYYDKIEGAFMPCLKKSALSAFDWYVHSRNYEPRWIYAHHKIVYFNEFLIKYLVKTCSQYLFAFSLEKWESAFLEVVKKVLTDESFISTAVEIQAFEPNKDVINKSVELFRKYIEAFSQKTDDTNKKIGIQSTEEDIREIGNKLYTQWADGAQLTAQSQFMESLQWMSANSLGAFEIRRFLLGLLKNLATSDDSRVIVTCVCVIRCIQDFLSQARYSFTGYVLSPVTPFRDRVFNNYFYKSNDSDIDNLIKNFFLRFCENGKPRKLDAKEIDLIKLVYWHSEDNEWEKRHVFFCKMLTEYITHKYKKTLYKTNEEFRIFIRNVIKKLSGNSTPAFTEKEIIDEFLKLIVTGDYIEFEDVKQAQAHPSREEFNLNAERVYVNANDFCTDECAHSAESDFSKVFQAFRGIVVRIHKCTFKNCDDLKIQFDNGVFDYGEFNVNRIGNPYFIPFIYYDSYSHNSKDNDIGNILDELANKFAEYLVNKKLKRSDNLDFGTMFSEGKMVRDSVHGNIFLPNRFLNVVNCRVFQRLRSIKQLAVADKIYPEATHTRFSHSLGVYHITTLMLRHFEPYFKRLHIPVTDEDTDALLLAALLHDVGHGPFSHTFENIEKNAVSNNKYSHEKLTVQIIENDEELKNTIKANFHSKSDNFYKKVSEIIKYNENLSDEVPSELAKVYRDLICSNLDADRMDYLMRDSYNTGEKFGIFDIQRLIDAMELTEYKGETRVAIRMDSISAVEQFIVGRYNMYKNVYNAPYKIFTEELLCRICRGLFELQVANRKGNMYNVLIDPLSHFCKLDDSKFLQMIRDDVEDISDDVTKKQYTAMLASFEYREGYERKRIKAEEQVNVNKMVSDRVICFINELSPKSKLDAFKTNSLINVVKQYYAYNKDSDILMLDNMGVIKKFSDCSNLCQPMSEEGYLWRDQATCCYFNFDVCRLEIQRILNSSEKIDFEPLRAQLDKLFESLDPVEHMEIENKYYCDDGSLNKISDILNVKREERVHLEGWEIYLNDKREIEQEDTYYDTERFTLAECSASLRIRKKNTKIIVTFKLPEGNDNTQNKLQFVRQEEECELSSDKFEPSNVELVNFLQQHVFNKYSDLNMSSFKQIVKIENARSSYDLSDNLRINPFRCELCLDRVKYKGLLDNGSKEIKDYQLEIELKSAYSYRVLLSKFANEVCERAGICRVEDNNISKYQKALKSLNYFTN